MSGVGLIELTPRGMYCAEADVYIDPWGRVDRAICTHAHGDHLAWGCGRVLMAEEGLPVARARLGDNAAIDTLRYGESTTINGVRISLHPAGHILGSAQVRLERGGEVWVVTGDYKIEPDPTCTPFELVPCTTLVTECTFGLPVFRWPDRDGAVREVRDWWAANRERGVTSVLYGYALGKAQRLLAMLADPPGPIYTHGAVEKLVRRYREAGIDLPPTEPVGNRNIPGNDGALILAPPSANGTPWLRRFTPFETAFASGWMRIRGHRRRRAVDRGFVVSDHVDWPGLLAVIRDTGAQTVGLTHGTTGVVGRYLDEQGLPTFAWPTRFEGEQDDTGGDEEPDS